jgi:hypothetical protein
LLTFKALVLHGTAIIFFGGSLGSIIESLKLLIDWFYVFEDSSFQGCETVQSGGNLLSFGRHITTQFL